MATFQRSDVKAAAANTLSQAPNARKLVLIHTGATLLLTVLLTLLDYLLEQKIGATGGLSGISTRTVLTTAQSVLRYIQLLVLPVWNCGYLLVCLQLSRGEQADTHTLLAGFFRFGPVFRLKLLQALIYLAVGFACVYLSSIVFVMTPWARPLMDALTPMMTTGELSPEVLMAALEPVALPLFAIFGVIFLAACLPIYYSLFFAELAIMNGEKKGALAAISESLRITRGNRMALLKLDLSFWWYFALDLLVSILAYGDLLLKALGVTLPWSADVSYFLFLGLYSAA